MSSKRQSQFNQWLFPFVVLSCLIPLIILSFKDQDSRTTFLEVTKMVLAGLLGSTLPPNK
jgi:hypothetical protein